MSARASENRAVLLTAPGAAAIAVVRVVGPGVGAFLGRHFSRVTEVGRCVHGVLADEGGEVIDDPVVVRIDEGRADVNVHGGPWVVRSVLELLGRSGFEVVQVGSGGALPEEALDEVGGIEREVKAYLPLARTELAVRVLLGQPGAWES